MKRFDIEHHLWDDALHYNGTVFPDLDQNTPVLLNPFHPSLLLLYVHEVFPAKKVYQDRENYFQEICLKFNDQTSLFIWLTINWHVFT
jgi:hypothetical protein